MNTIRARSALSMRGRRSNQGKYKERYKRKIYEIYMVGLSHLRREGASDRAIDDMRVTIYGWSISAFFYTPLVGLVRINIATFPNTWHVARIAPDSRRRYRCSNAPH